MTSKKAFSFFFLNSNYDSTQGNLLAHCQGTAVGLKGLQREVELG